jgi:hypothetical protein
METVKKDESKFRPMGEKFHEYTVKGVDNATYELYKVKYNDIPKKTMYI